MTWEVFLNNFISIASGFLIFYLGRYYEKTKIKDFLDKIMFDVKENKKVLERTWEFTQELVPQCMWAFDHLSKKNKETFRKLFMEKKDETRE